MEYLNKKAEVMEDLYDGKIKSESSSIDKDCLKFIEDWISDISLSEKYFQSKYGRADKKIVDIDKSEIFIDDNLLIQWINPEFSFLLNSYHSCFYVNFLL